MPKAPIESGGTYVAPAATPVTPVATPVAATTATTAQTAVVAQIIAAAVVNSPAVVDTPKNVAPSAPAVAAVAQQVAQAVAPVVAPSLPPAVIQTIVQETSKAVVANPTVKASDVGQTAPAAVVQTIANAVATTPAVTSAVSYNPTTGLSVNPNGAPAATIQAPAEAAPLANPPANVKAESMIPTASATKSTAIGQPAPTPVTPMPAQAAQPGTAGFVGPTISTTSTTADTPSVTKATEIMAVDDAKTAAYQDALTAPAKTQAEIDAINAGVKQVTESTGNVYDPTKAMTVANQPTLNTTVQSTNNFSPNITINTPSTDKTLAIDTFRSTLALFFGKDEVQKPWVDALYKVTSKYYNSGSTIDESINLSVQDARNNPELKTFADRFSGIYSLQDKLVKGEAISVPTVSEYFKSESAMGDVLRQAGMGDLANQQFLGGILGMGKSVLEVTNLINDTFSAIDNAPGALKKDLQSFLSLGVSKTDIAKALLTGKDGAQALNKKITEISTLSAAKSQNVTIDMATAADIAARGYDYNKSLAGFADVKRLERGQMLGKMSGIDFTQKDAIAAQFESDYAAQDKIAKIGEEEVNRFSSRTGRFNSQNRAQGLI